MKRELERVVQEEPQEEPSIGKRRLVNHEVEEETRSAKRLRVAYNCSSEMNFEPCDALRELALDRPALVYSSSDQYQQRKVVVPMFS